MKINRMLLAGLAALACLVPATAAAAKPAATQKQYYLALGDSLSRGAQPNSSGVTLPTRQGYPNDLFTWERQHVKGLALKELGCLGETTTTMIKGGICKYAAGSQLNAAVAFLKANAGHIAFVTIDIGANDVDQCVNTSTGAINLKCVARGEATIKKNLPKIASALRKAAGTKVPIVGMTYYDPFLAQWFAGSSGQQEAGLSQQLAREVNGEITTAYKATNVAIAHVDSAFLTYKPFTDTELFEGGQVPVAVAGICQLTWMCAASPVGPNIHANPAGYALIASVFEGKL